MDSRATSQQRGFVPPMTTRILIADDHEMVRAGIRAVLAGREGWEMVAAASKRVG